MTYNYDIKRMEETEPEWGSPEYCKKHGHKWRRDYHRDADRDGIGGYRLEAYYCKRCWEYGYNK